jgi:hypothetical protein
MKKAKQQEEILSCYKAIPNLNKENWLLRCNWKECAKYPPYKIPHYPRQALRVQKNTPMCFEVDFGFPPLSPLSTHMNETLKLIKFGAPIFGHIDWILEAN